MRRLVVIGALLVFVVGFAAFVAPQPTMAAKGGINCGDAQPGNTYFLDLDAPSAPNLNYVMAASLGVRPGIPLPDGRTIPLNIDPVLLLSLTTPAIFQNFQSVLDPAGHATANFNIPAIVALIGQRFYFAYVVIDPPSPSGIRLVSNPWGVTIR